MRTLRILLISLLAVLALPVAQAQDARPTEQSIRELLAVMQSHNMIDTMLAQFDATWGPMMKQAMGGRQQLTEREQQIVDDAHAKVQALTRDLLRWENFEPMIVRVYQNTFSQKDVDAMKAFYSSPTGQVVIAKLPLAMQQSMKEMSERVSGLVPQIQQIKADMQAQLQAEREAAGAQSPGAAEPAPH